MWFRSSLRALLLLAISSTNCRALSISFSQTHFNMGEIVNADITASSHVVIESDLSKSSTSVLVDGDETVPIGEVWSPGFYSIQISEDTTVNRYLLIMEPSDAGFDMTVVDLSQSSNATSSSHLDLLDKFQSAFTQTRLKRALTKVVPIWLAENSTSATSIAVLCFIPSFQAACGIELTGHAIDLGVTIMKEVIASMVADDLLTDSDGEIVSSLLGIGNVITQIGLSADRVDKLMTAGGAIMEATANTPDGTVIAKFTGDGVKRFRMLIHLVKK